MRFDPNLRRDLWDPRFPRWAFWAVMALGVPFLAFAFYVAAVVMCDAQ